MAIDDILDEHEQSERVLEWLRRNGAGLIGGILLGMAAIGGWKWWGQHQEQREFQLADQYQVALDAIQANDEQAGAKVKGLGASVYGTLAALQLAEAQVAAGQRDAAVATLRAAPPSDPAISAVVDQRLARLLLDAGQAGEALKLIGTATTPSALELLGDARYALGQRDEAREAYVQALGKQDLGSPRRRLLELKLTEVGGAPAQTEAQS